MFFGRATPDTRESASLQPLATSRYVLPGFASTSNLT
jgi:hypothetical protein